MPPKVKYSKEAIVAATLDIIRKSGMEAVNARAIASALGCSTQPLFREFQTVEQIKQEASALAMGMYRRYVQVGMASADKPYKASGMAYLRFAQEEPQLFRLLFMCDRKGSETKQAENDETLDAILQPLMATTGFTREQAQAFHLYSWIFVHGMASMIATGYIQFTQDELSALLSDSFVATRLLFERKRSEQEQTPDVPPDSADTDGTAPRRRRYQR